jgi:cytochrome c-type biogenesis protein CcmH
MRRGAVASWLAVAGPAAVVLAALLWSSLGGPRPSTIEERSQAIATGLRCPVCQNLSVADSPSGLAREMRATISTQLRAGWSPDQIRRYFVQRYGVWVLLAPPQRGLDLLPWLVPAIGLGLGLALWARFLRRRAPAETEGAQ